MTYDVIVIGGGAAGLFCAIAAGKRGRRVLVIEHNAEVGRKILISGGGRCNFTNLYTQPENFISRNPHFCKSALSRYKPDNFLALIKKHNIAYYEKKLGQLFCRDRSSSIVDLLLRECRDARVEIRTGCSVENISKNDQFTLDTNDGPVKARQLVIACGGLSFKKIGASDLGYRVARQFGLKMVETRPSLVALVLETESYSHLAGVSIDSLVSVGKHSFRENILFTHRGLSGPAILQISNYWQKTTPVTIDLLPGSDITRLLTSEISSRRHLSNYLSELMPQRFARSYAGHHFPDKQLAQLTKKEIMQIGDQINRWQVKFGETEGYDRAEVTLGGISTDELSSQTMESKKVPGLFFIGELVDVTGWLGGYNFQWAWASGFAAGSSV